MTTSRFAVSRARIEHHDHATRYDDMPEWWQRWRLFEHLEPAHEFFNPPFQVWTWTNNPQVEFKEIQIPQLCLCVRLFEWSIPSQSIQSQSLKRLQPHPSIHPGRRRACARCRGALPPSTTAMIDWQQWSIDIMERRSASRPSWGPHLAVLSPHSQLQARAGGSLRNELTAWLRGRRSDAGYSVAAGRSCTHYGDTCRQIEGHAM